MLCFYLAVIKGEWEGGGGLVQSHLQGYMSLNNAPECNLLLISLNKNSSRTYQPTLCAQLFGKGVLWPYHQFFLDLRISGGCTMREGMAWGDQHPMLLGRFFSQGNMSPPSPKKRDLTDLQKSKIVKRIAPVITEPSKMLLQIVKRVVRNVGVPLGMYRGFASFRGGSWNRWRRKPDSLLYREVWQRSNNCAQSVPLERSTLTTRLRGEKRKIIKKKN